MRQGAYVAGGHRQHRVEQSRQRDALSLRHQLEVGRVGVECPAAGLRNREFLLVCAENHLLTEHTVVGLIGQLQRVGAMPLSKDHGNRLSGDQPVDA